MKKLMMAACAGLLLFAFTAEANLAFTAEANPGKGNGKGKAHAYGLQKNQTKHQAKQQAKMYKEQQKAARKQQKEWNKANGGDDDDGYGYRYGNGDVTQRGGGDVRNRRSTGGVNQPTDAGWSLGDIFNGL